MKRILRLLTFILILSLILWGIFHFREEFKLEILKTTIESFALWAPLVFMGIYISAILLLLPGSGMTILGGLLFGPLWGLIYSMTAAVVGATIAFLIARYIASDWVVKRAKGKLKQLIEGVEAQGWKFVAVVRLIPLIPFTMLNYALGVTRVSLSTYIITSSIFMIPACFAYTYVGSLGMVAIKGEVKELVTKGLFAVGLLVLLSVLPWIVKRLRKNK